jgi:hypothetical protein
MPANSGTALLVYFDVFRFNESAIPATLLASNYLHRITLSLLRALSFGVFIFVFHIFYRIGFRDRCDLGYDLLAEDCAWCDHV